MSNSCKKIINRQTFFKTNFTTLVLTSFVLSVSYFTFKTIKWKTYIWLPEYFSQALKPKEITNDIKHIIFFIVDHYEPGYGDKGAELNRKWLSNHKKLVDHHHDSYGRRPQHTFFYAYDHHNEQVMSDLSNYVNKFNGEIEFHWHHKYDNNETFPRKLEEGLVWFNRYGAMIDANGKRSFGFIHGDWSLDNASGENFCGVTKELEILKKAGCYADFTFPSFGSIAQPQKVNCIYYGKDDEQDKSYENGINARVGLSNSKDLMIFQGPLALTEYGAIENDPYPNPQKVDKWIETNIHIQGRPEWIFIKTFTHGAQSRRTWFSTPVVDNLFSYLENRYGVGEYRLHYVTAREAYNIVRAAEDGKSGDPQQYLDYQVLPPKNKHK